MESIDPLPSSGESGRERSRRASRVFTGCLAGGEGWADSPPSKISCFFPATSAARRAAPGLRDETQQILARQELFLPTLPVSYPKKMGKFSVYKFRKIKFFVKPPLRVVFNSAETCYDDAKMN